MSGKDQEQFEDYLELERYIEKLQAGHAAYPPLPSTPDQARIYHMVMLFHSVSNQESEPHPEFAVVLWTHLEQELQQLQTNLSPFFGEYIHYLPFCDNPCTFGKYPATFRYRYHDRLHSRNHTGATLSYPVNKPPFM